MFPKAMILAFISLVVTQSAFAAPAFQDGSLARRDEPWICETTEGSPSVMSAGPLVDFLFQKGKEGDIYVVHKGECNGNILPDNKRARHGEAAIDICGDGKVLRRDIYNAALDLRQHCGAREGKGAGRLGGSNLVPSSGGTGVRVRIFHS